MVYATWKRIHYLSVDHAAWIPVLIIPRLEFNQRMINSEESGAVSTVRIYVV
jgi:hypothetical protein